MGSVAIAWLTPDLRLFSDQCEFQIFTYECVLWSLRNLWRFRQGWLVKVGGGRSEEKISWNRILKKGFITLELVYLAEEGTLSGCDHLSG